MNLILRQWQGSFKQVETAWLRWAQLNGDLLLTAEEQASQRAEQASQRADRLAEQLRALGEEPGGF